MMGLVRTCAGGFSRRVLPLLEHGIEVGLEVGKGRIEHLRPGHNYDVEARRRLSSPEEFSRQAFRAIPHHRGSELACRCDA